MGRFLKSKPIPAWYYCEPALRPAMIAMASILDFLVQFWAVLVEMAPYLLFGFLMAGALHVLLPKNFVGVHLGGRGFLPVLKAALIGVPLPLCSCGVIPVAASLRNHGASRGATASFLLSTPQTGVDSILVTYSLLGWVFALYRVLVAFVTGVLGGWLVDLLDKRGAASDGGERHVSGTHATHSDGMRSGADKPNASRRTLEALHYGLVTLPRDLGWTLVIGLLVAAVISTLFKPGALHETVLGGGILPMLIMVVIGIPMYVCATASVPIASALILAGVSPGAALAFLIAGPATNAATIGMLWKFLGRTSAMVYLAVIAGAALAFGALLDVVYLHPAVAPLCHAHELLPGWLGQATAVLLVLVMVNAMLSKPAAKPVAAALPEEETRVLAVKGMNCSHCVSSVEQALSGQPGVRSVSVDLQGERATVVGRDLKPGILVAAVEAIGFSATPAE